MGNPAIFTPTRCAIDQQCRATFSISSDTLVLPRCQLCWVASVRRQVHCYISQCVQGDTLDKNLHVTELKPDCRHYCVGSLPRATRLIVHGLGVLDMHVCYLLSDTDAGRCRISLREKSAVSLLSLDIAGRVACLTGVVQSIQFDPNRATGLRWRVEMDLSTVASITQTPSGSK
jgi:hypothetical protein